jgi:nitrogen fixation protein NifU and related proteins
MSYSAIFRDHLAHPRNVGEIAGATVEAEETNPVCGDRLRLSLLVHEGKIESAKYLAYGCPPTLVSGSVLTELLVGQTIEQVATITKSQLIDAVGGLPQRKHHAAALAIEALETVLQTLRSQSLTGEPPRP